MACGVRAAGNRCEAKEALARLRKIHPNFMQDDQANADADV
jgi:hypothetical protein